MGLLKVSSKSSPASVAGAIAGLVKDQEPVTLQCIGAGAVNQAIKAVAIARGFLTKKKEKKISRESTSLFLSVKSYHISSC